jgi:glycosyltransferase involved in cell wall biosynthesis
MRIYLTRIGPLRPVQWAGVSRYTACMVRAIRELAPEVEFVATHYSLRMRLPPGVESLESEFGVRVLPERWPDFSGFPGYHELLDRWVVPRTIERHRARIAWGTNCSVPSSRGRQFRSVVTIHDLFLLLKPELAAPEFRHTLRQLESLTGHCDLVLTDSEFSRGQIIERLGFSADRVVVTPLAAAPAATAELGDDPRETLAKFGLRAPPVLSVGTVEARKNYVRGLEAFARVRRQAGNNLMWIIVGARGWQWEAVYQERTRLGLNDSVVIRHDVSDAELAELYRGGRCLFFPSPHEGFGLPALEAMATGLPVVAARAGALPEVVGDAAVLVDAQSPEDMASGLMCVLIDERLRADLAERGRRQAGRFSWSQAAARALDAFRQLVS